MLTKFALARVAKMFSKNNIYIAFTNFDELPRLLEYKNKMIRPMIIVLIHSNADYDEYVNLCNKIDMNDFKIIMAFRGIVDRLNCTKPIGNPFKLNFDSRMLVRCYNSSILTEWYSLYPNKIKTFKLIRFKPEGSYERLTDLSFAQRRRSMGGIKLKVTTTKVREFSVSVFFF